MQWPGAVRNDDHDLRELTLQSHEHCERSPVYRHQYSSGAAQGQDESFLRFPFQGFAAVRKYLVRRKRLWRQTANHLFYPHDRCRGCMPVLAG